MKIQCSCGAKFAFDITAEMAGNAVKFVCPACGLDISDYVNHLSETSEAPLAPATSDVQQRCPKHPDQFVTDRCYVCSKPLCPKCMELFGYVCSPLCRGKAEAQGIEVPLYAGQKSVREARLWRKTVRTTTTIAAVVLSLLGFWFWYAWIGGIPRPVYSVAFAQPAYSGRSFFGGKDQLKKLISSLIKSDVDSNSDGIKDAKSVSLDFSTLGGTISGMSP